MINSYKLAKDLGKRHDNLKRLIESYKSVLGGRFCEVFKPSTFKNIHKHTYPCYIITQEGYELLRKHFNGEVKKAAVNKNDDKRIDSAIYALGDTAKAIKAVFDVNDNKAFDVAANMVEKAHGVDLSALRGLVPGR